jgi:DNA-binding NtrC family response regulator
MSNRGASSSMRGASASQRRPAATVTVVDDDRDVGQRMAECIEPMGCVVTVFSDSRDALSFLLGGSADIVIADVKMPHVDGITLLKEVKSRFPSTHVIVVTGYADKQVAIDALKLGAFDFFEKPLQPEVFVQTVKRLLDYRSAAQESDRLAAKLSEASRTMAPQGGIEGCVGRSEALQRILAEVQTLQTAAGTPVFISGESGTGKELIARAIHFGSSRSTGPFVPVNCAAIPSELAESMLFGHIKGAFTGAVNDRKGFFELAHDGTLFLDEIGDMPSHVQTRLLRVLEDGVVVPVGGTKSCRVDVRVVAATNADIRKRVESGAFRLDLFYRLAAFTIEVPPLRDRIGDIPLLAKHFAQMFAAEMGYPVPLIGADTVSILEAHQFPGNIRELKNVMERAVMESRGKTIEPRHVHFQGFLTAAGKAKVSEIPSNPPTEVDMPLNFEAAEQNLIQRAVTAAGGNVAAAARMLGINRTSLYRKMAKHRHVADMGKR